MVVLSLALFKGWDSEVMPRGTLSPLTDWQDPAGATDLSSQAGIGELHPRNRVLLWLRELN